MNAIVEDDKNADEQTAGDDAQHQRSPVGIIVYNSDNHQAQQDKVRDKRVENLENCFSHARHSIFFGGVIPIRLFLCMVIVLRELILNIIHCHSPYSQTASFESQQTVVC